MTKVGVIRAGGRGWNSRSKMKADILIVRWMMRFL